MKIAIIRKTTTWILLALLFICFSAIFSFYLFTGGNLSTYYLFMGDNLFPYVFAVAFVPILFQLIIYIIINSASKVHFIDFIFSSVVCALLSAVSLGLIIWMSKNVDFYNQTFMISAIVTAVVSALIFIINITGYFLENKEKSTPAQIKIRLIHQIHWLPVLAAAVLMLTARISQFFLVELGKWFVIFYLGFYPFAVLPLLLYSALNAIDNSKDFKKYFLKNILLFLIYAGIVFVAVWPISIMGNYAIVYFNVVSPVIWAFGVFLIVFVVKLAMFRASLKEGGRIKMEQDRIFWVPSAALVIWVLIALIIDTLAHFQFFYWQNAYYILFGCFALIVFSIFITSVKLEKWQYVAANCFFGLIFACVLGLQIYNFISTFKLGIFAKQIATFIALVLPGIVAFALFWIAFGSGLKKILSTKRINRIFC